MGNAEVIAAESGSEALAILEREPDIDIVLMDIMMPIMDGYETMRAIRALEAFKTLPIIAVTGKVMAGERERCIDAGANDYVPKPIDSPILLAAIKPWLVLSEAPVSAPVVAGSGGDPTAPPDDKVLGPQILVVDDDFGNTFALAALLERGHRVIVAGNGDEALEVLEQSRDVDVVLMDIMMPLMDGYDTMRAIRAFEHCRTLPIIAVTGKVMPGERERCIEAGANDYVPKPVDSAELFAALRPWLPTPAQQTAA